MLCRRSKVAERCGNCTSWYIRYASQPPRILLIDLLNRICWQPSEHLYKVLRSILHGARRSSNPTVRFVFCYLSPLAQKCDRLSARTFSLLRNGTDGGTFYIFHANRHICNFVLPAKGLMVSFFFSRKVRGCSASAIVAC